MKHKAYYFINYMVHAGRSTPSHLEEYAKGGWLSSQEKKELEKAECRNHRKKDVYEIQSSN